MGMYLTALEIKHLAESAGFEISESATPEEDWDAEHWIGPPPSGGVENDDGIVEHYRLITRCDGCDSNECTPLGNPISH